MRAILFISMILYGLVFYAESSFAYSLVSVTPKGDVKQVRQVRLQFSDAMISFGDPNVSPAAVVHCASLPKDISGTGRWLSVKEWVYEFSQELPAGLICTVKLTTGLSDLKKTTLSGSGSFEFSTGGPAIARVKPYPGAALESEAAVLVLLDAEPDINSVLARAYFTASGIGEKIGVRLGDAATTKAVVKQAYFYGDEKKKVPLLLIAKRTLAPKAKLKLIWDKGITSKTGVPTSVQQHYEFTVREDFNAKFSCQRDSANAQCSPFSALRVEMTSNIPIASAQQFELQDASGKIFKPKKNTSERDVSWVDFEAPFAPKAEYTIVLPKDLKDVDGRVLANAGKFPLKVMTADYAPLAKFSARFGLIEAGPEAALPLAVRKLEPDVTAKFAAILKASGENGSEFLGVEWRNAKSVKIDRPQDVIYWLDRLESVDREISLFDADERIQKNDKLQSRSTPVGLNRVLTTPLKLPVSTATSDTQIIGIPLASKGFHLVELESPMLAKALIGEKASFFVPAGALVTNLAVHFKWGGARSLAWVTTLDHAKPVAKAHVQLFDCSGAELFAGNTDSDGVLVMDRELPQKDIRSCPLKGHSSYGQGLFVFATKGDDFTFTHTSWQSGIENWRFSVPTSWDMEQDYVAHTILDRTLLRAGETVHMKHVFRKSVIAGFGRADKEKMPNQLEISFMNGNTWKQDIDWRADGTAETSWKIPQEAKLGTYRIRLHSSKTSERGHSSFATGSFEVQEFRVPLMKTILKMPATPQVAADSIDVPVQIQYMAGGAASQLPVKLRSIVSVKNYFSFPQWHDFSFSQKQVKVGVSKQKNGQDDMEYSGAEEGVENDENAGTTSDQVSRSDLQNTLNLTLDSSGGSVGAFKHLPKDQGYDFAVEAEYRDPNGETQISRQTTTVFPSNRLVGFDNTRWVNLKSDLQLKMIVVDSLGKVQSGVPVDVALYSHKVNSHRKRIIGGFYSYENYDEIKEVEPNFCHAVSDANGLVRCSGKTSESGELMAQALVKDSAGHKFYGYSSFWVRGDDDWWFSQEAGDRIDLVPERKEYNPGDMALFQVRSPFREATVLVTTEREGVVDYFVTNISGKDPTIAVPIKGNYGPNIYVSALLVRGRVGAAASTALLDLGKPAFKMGLAGIKVGWEAHRLDVTVTPDRQVYKIREKMRVKIKVKPDGDGEAFKGGTVLIAAVDEGLLQLMPNKTWDLLAHMMGDRQHAVKTSTAQLQVIGKRHFGLKAIAAGGGGGAGAPRKLFDTLLLWQDQISVDRSGSATIDIPLNDSLTSFRIVAIAIGGEGRFGTGEASIRTSQDVLVFSGLPPLVREGDVFKGLVTLRNTSEDMFDLKVSAKVEGLSANGPVSIPVPSQRQVHLDPGQSGEAMFEVTVPVGATELHWVVDTTSIQGKLLDRLDVKQSVKPVLPVRVLQTTLQRAAPQMSLEVERPKNALGDRGGVRVELSSSLVSQLATSQSYMTEYPYSCLEQRISKAVSLNDSARWSTVADGIGNYLDHDGLAKFFPDERWGYDILTSYALSVSARNHFDIPSSMKQRMTGGLSAWLAGRVSHQEEFLRPDRPMRVVAALLALSLAANDSFKPKLVDDYVDIQPQLWPTSTLISWYQLLLRERGINKRTDLLKIAETQIRTRLHAEGNTISFAKAESQNPYWLMMSPAEALARLIDTLSDADEALVSAGFREDLPRLVQGLFLNQREGHWDLTITNAWAAVGLRSFGKAFEKEQVTGETLMNLGMDQAKWRWLADQSRSSHLKGPTDMDSNPATHDFDLEAAKSTLQVKHNGGGAPWVMISSRFAMPVTAAIRNGMSLERKIVPLERKVPGKWSKGDVVRVDLAMSSTAAQVWVVLNDPIPSGATILGGVGNQSSLAKKDHQSTDLTPSFQERSFEGMRTYYSYVPDSTWTYSYSFRLNQEGSFALPASRLEAMYSPGMFAETPTETWTVE